MGDTDARVECAIPIDAANQQEYRTASGFLRSVFAGQEKGVLAMFCKPGNMSYFSHMDRSNWYLDAAATAMQLRDHVNVYYAIGLQGTRPEKGRGKEAGVILLPGLWADIDVLGPNHAALALPPTIEDAMRIVQGVPFKPTVVVHTGGGIQAYWLFKEPWELDSDKERKKAKALSKAFQKHLQGGALECGWTMDGTADLCRLLRLPGTYNRKQAEPVLVRYEVIADGRRYNPSDFEEFLSVEADPELKAHVQGPAPDQPTAEFLKVLAGCSWIRHCKDDAASLSEPEWYRMLSIVGRCKDGVHLAHELSRPFPKYSELETTEKLKQAMGAAGPATCTFIGGELGCGHHCGDFNHRGKIASPVVLGIPKRANRGKDQGTDSHPRSSGLPNIQANDRQLREVTNESLAALRAFNNPPSIFVRAGKPVCIHKEETGRHIIIDATDRIIRNRLTRAADFYEITMDGFRKCSPPMDMVKDILATPPMEWEFPALQGIIEAPAFREDGTIITAPGYDEQSGLYYAQQDALSMPEIPEHPKIG